MFSCFLLNTNTLHLTILVENWHLCHDQCVNFLFEVYILNYQTSRSNPVMHVQCSFGCNHNYFIMVLSMDKIRNDLANEFRSSYCFVFHWAEKGAERSSISTTEPSSAAWELVLLLLASRPKAVDLLSLTSNMSSFYHLILLKSCTPSVWERIWREYKGWLTQKA